MSGLLPKSQFYFTIDPYLKSQQMQQFSKYRAKDSRAVANVPEDLGLWKYSRHITSAV